MAGSGGKREGFLLQNVNVLLGGHLVLNRAMLAGLVLLVCLVCCCCRFTAMRKPPSDSPSSYWLQDATASPDDEELTCDREIEHGIYTLDLRPVPSNVGHVGVWPSPPPPYSSLRLQGSISEANSAGSTASLPTYDAAVQLRALHL